MPATFWPEWQPERLVKVLQALLVVFGNNDGGMDEMLGKKWRKALVEDEDEKIEKMQRMSLTFGEIFMFD
ncbi:hypothetical protein Hanom_Chr16g01523401 [Helianthus anomalus]